MRIRVLRMVCGALLCAACVFAQGKPEQSARLTRAESAAVLVILQELRVSFDEAGTAASLKKALQDTAALRGTNLLVLRTVMRGFAAHADSVLWAWTSLERDTTSTGKAKARLFARYMPLSTCRSLSSAWRKVREGADVSIVESRQ